ncbi:MAG: hypothetical protein AAGA95_15215, partial [Pseudomonadota bacterium]
CSSFCGTNGPSSSKGPTLRLGLFVWRHGLCFDLRTGRARQGGNAVLGRYSLAYEGRNIGVDL